MITCSKCKQSKDKSEFYKGQRRCKACALQYQREWQSNNLTPDKAAEYRMRFAEKNPGYATAKKQEWEKKNPERAQELYRHKLERNKERYRLKVEATGRKVGERPPKLTYHQRTQRSLANNPVRAAAIKIYKYAIRRGQLVRGPCAVCGTTEGIDGHHTDYTQPLNVVWLCKPHHREEHKRIRCEAA